MTANRSVVQETLAGSTDTPRLTRTDGVLIHDTYEHFNPDQDPNLEEQVAIVTTLLDNWLVTRAADYFSQKIYAGESLDANHDVVYSTVLYPAYKQSQSQFLQESAHMAMEVRATEATLLETRDILESKKSILPIIQQRELERRATNLETHAKNGRLTAKTKETMFRKIDAFLKPDNFEDIDEKVDEIISAARIHAIRQAIRTFESDLLLSRMPERTHLSAEQVKVLEYRLETLHAELAAITDIEAVQASPAIPQEVPVTIAHKETTPEHTSTLRGLRQIRILGGFSTAIAAFIK